MRQLASIQRVTNLSPIPGADRIEVARVLGWDVVVQKDLYKIGDLVVYFEIDSILPDKPWCEFMRDRKYRVKTIKLRKQISQGLCIPMGECLDIHKPWSEDTDVTEHLGVKKHDPQGDKERASNVSQRQPVPHAWMLRFEIGRKLHQYIWPRKKGSWPQWFPKTDETRVQNLPNIDALTQGRVLYATEKLDGQSVTMFYERAQRTGLFSTGLFGVCSRNIWYKALTSNNWWNIAVKLNVQEALENYCNNEKRSIAIQGEIVGPGIQKNRYKLEEKHLFIFNVYDIDNQKYLPLDEKLDVVKILGLQMVPLLPELTINLFEPDYLEMAEGESLLYPTEREGVVFRDAEDDSFSFKAISNKFLLKEDSKR